MLNDFENISVLKEYIARKKAEYGAEISHKKITNIGTFRKYVEFYIKNHPDIHKGLTRMVRQLPSGPQGIPIEIYSFTNTTDWLTYENIQADIFDHLIAVTADFKLKIFQDPSGSDFSKFMKKH